MVAEWKLAGCEYDFRDLSLFYCRHSQQLCSWRLAAKRLEAKYALNSARDECVRSCLLRVSPGDKLVCIAAKLREVLIISPPR